MALNMHSNHYVVLRFWHAPVELLLQMPWHQIGGRASDHGVTSYISHCDCMHINHLGEMTVWTTRWFHFLFAGLFSRSVINNSLRKADKATHIQGSFCVCAQPKRDGVTVYNAISHWLWAYTEWSLHIECACQYKIDLLRTRYTASFQ